MRSGRELPAGEPFAVAHVKQDLLVRLQSFGLIEKIGAELMFPALPTALGAYEEWAREHSAQPGPEGAGDG